MKVKLLRDHLGHKKGQEIEVTKQRAKYFELVGVAKQAIITNAKTKKK